MSYKQISSFDLLAFFAYLRGRYEDSKRLLQYDFYNMDYMCANRVSDYALHPVSIYIISTLYPACLYDGLFAVFLPSSGQNYSAGQQCIHICS